MENKVEICAYCQRPIHPQVGTAVCSDCGAVYHRKCWDKRDACVTVGCTGAPILTSAWPLELQNRDLSHTFVQEPEDGPVQTVYRCRDTVVFEDVSLLLEDVKLVLDRENSELNAYFSFRNLQTKPIWAMKLELSCFDIWGEPLDEPHEYEFIDLHAKFNQPFLSGAPILLLISNTRRIQVDVKKVLYVDGTVTLGAGAKEILPPLTTLQEHFGSAELAGQYARQTTELASYVPEKGQKYWRCTCGAVHDAKLAACSNCGCQLMQAQSWLSREKLAREMPPVQPRSMPVAPVVAAKPVAVPVAAPQNVPAGAKPTAVPVAAPQSAPVEAAKPVPVTAKAEPAKAAKPPVEKTPRRKHPVRKAVCWLLALALVVGLVAFVAIPGYNYLLGQKALKAGAYDNAYKRFSSIPWFLDSEELADQCAYERATELLNAKQYDQARAVFADLGDYSNAATMVIECYYQEGKELTHAREYGAATEAFSHILGYRDTDEYLGIIANWKIYWTEDEEYYYTQIGDAVMTNLPGVVEYTANGFWSNDFYYFETENSEKMAIFAIYTENNSFITIRNYIDHKEYTLFR